MMGGDHDDDGYDGAGDDDGDEDDKDDINDEKRKVRGCRIYGQVCGQWLPLNIVMCHERNTHCSANAAKAKAKAV